jgi:hypothetical protein
MNTASGSGERKTELRTDLRGSIDMFSTVPAVATGGEERAGENFAGIPASSQPIFQRALTDIILPPT